MVDKIVEERLQRIEGQLGVLVNRSSNPGAKAQTPKICTRQVTFSETVPASQEFTMEEPCPLTGEITQVTMHFPNGCNGLVGLQFGHKGIPVMPSKKEEFIALNDATPTWPGLREEVSKGEKLWAILRNGDAAWPHKPSVIVVITGVE